MWAGAIPTNTERYSDGVGRKQPVAARSQLGIELFSMFAAAPTGEWQTLLNAGTAAKIKLGLTKNASSVLFCYYYKCKKIAE